MTTTELLPLGQSIPPAVLKKDFVKLEDKPYGQPALGYSVVLPNDWLQLKLKATDARLHVEHPKLLSTFLGPKDDGGNPMFQVWCQGLIREISAGDWLKDFLTRTGHEIISLEIRSAYLADALVTRRDGPVLLKIRYSARLAGYRLFLCEGAAPDDLFPKYADGFGLASCTFKPTLSPTTRTSRSGRRIPWTMPFPSMRHSRGLNGTRRHRKAWTWWTFTT